MTAGRWILAAAFALLGMLGAVQIIWIGLARETLERGQSRTAFATLRSSPILPASVRVLGQKRNRLRPGSGDELMLLAGQLSWRDIPTQIWLVERALHTGDHEVAVQRTEALVRQNFRPEAALPLLRQLSAEPEARALLVRSLAERPAWRRRFLADPSVPQGQWPLHAAVLRDLARTSAPPTRTEANPIIEALATAGRYGDAHHLYRQLFGADPVQLARPVEGATIFDWRFPTLEGAGTTVEPGEDSLELLAQTSGTASGPIAARTFVLPAGAYELRYRLRSEALDAAAAFPVTVFCAGGNALAAAAGSTLPDEDWQARTLAFNLPAGCPAVHVQLLAAPSPDGQGREAELDGFQLVPLRR